jgi:hypothetical protein
LDYIHGSDQRDELVNWSSITHRYLEPQASIREVMILDGQSSGAVFSPLK